MAGDVGTGKDVEVNCWPLEAMLRTLGVMTVDYCSLDVEGAEPAILAAIDFDSIDIKVFTVEVNDAQAESAV